MNSIFKNKSEIGGLLSRFSFLLVICWSLIPALYWRFSSKYAAVLIVISFVGAIMDSNFTLKEMRGYIVSYSAAAMLTFYIWYFVRRENFNSLLYVANGIIVWYPVIFSRYLKKIKDSRYNQVVFITIAMCICFTGITTIIGQLKHPMASRLLAGGGVRSELELYAGMNIGGYSYVYAAVIWIPYQILSIFSQKSGFKKPLSVLFILGFMVTITSIILSQYYIAIALMLAVTAVSMLLVPFSRKKRADTYLLSKPNRIYLTVAIGFMLAVFSMASIFLLSLSPAQQFMEQLGQSMLIERSRNIADVINENQIIPKAGTESVLPEGRKDLFDKDSTPIIEHDKLVGEEDQIIPKAGTESVLPEGRKDLFDKDSTPIIEHDKLVGEEDQMAAKAPKNALSARVEVYKKPLSGFLQSPWFGNAYAWYVEPSGHSEFFDALLCGGIFGSIIVLGLLYVIFRGLYKNSYKNMEAIPFVLISIIAFIGIAMVNTITHGKEIILVACLLPVLCVNGEASDDYSLVS